MAQSPQQPTLDDKDRRFDFRLIPWPPWPCWKNRGAVMGRHFTIGAVNHRIVEARLDDGDFSIVRYQKTRNTADRREGAGVGADPIRERLCPACLGIGQVRGAQYRDENLRRPGLAGQPVNNHRHRVAGIVDKQLVAAHMGLPHRHREPARPAAAQLTETRIPIPVGMLLDVLVPQDLQGDVLVALEFAVHRRPVGLGMATMTLLGADGGKEPRFEHRIAHLRRQWPAQPRPGQPLQG